MADLILSSKNRCFKGEQRYYTHHSEMTNSKMTFSVYLPDEAVAGRTCPAILFLSGLTTNPDNPTHKAHYQKRCSELGMIFIVPDTSPKGEAIPDDDRYFVGQGASYFVDAKREPWSENFNMHRYIIEEFYEMIRNHFAISSLGIAGHSMGGHGSIMFGFQYPSKFVSVSAIAPISVNSESDWGKAAYSEYFGEETKDTLPWSKFDAVSAIKKAGKQYSSILVDQGGADEFYNDGYLKPEALQAACQQVEQPLTLRYHAGYDHSYYFIQTVINDHIEYHHKAALNHSYTY